MTHQGQAVGGSATGPVACLPARFPLGQHGQHRCGIACLLQLDAELAVWGLAVWVLTKPWHTEAYADASGKEGGRRRDGAALGKA